MFNHLGRSTGQGVKEGFCLPKCVKASRASVQIRDYRFDTCVDETQGRHTRSMQLGVIMSPLLWNAIALSKQV